jgi:hypothetical protein
VGVVDEEQVEVVFDLSKPALGGGGVEAEHHRILGAIEAALQPVLNDSRQDNRIAGKAMGHG